MKCLRPVRVASLSLLGASALLVPARGAGPQQAGNPPAVVAADPRTADREAIQAALQSFRKAFEARDAKALAAHWTAEGEYRNDAGVTVQGQAALADAFDRFFAQTPEVKTELQPRGLRFLGTDAAVAEGSVKVRRGPSAAATRADFNALLVREQGHWRLAQLSETSDPGPSMEDLAWLVGEWQSVAGEAAEIHTTYAWSPSKKFIHGQFRVKEKDRELAGSQVIGIDPATGALHSWTFEADGGVGEADWTPDGDHWVLDAVGTLVDGATLAETNILRRVNDSTFTWQSIDRSLDDEAIPDLAPVKVTRVANPK